MSLLSLNLRQQPLLFLLIRRISLLLLPEAATRQNLSIFPQLSNCTFAFPFMLFLELGKLGAFTVGIVVPFWVE